MRSDPDKIVPGYDRLVQCGDACTGENYPVPRYVQTITRTPNARRKRRDGKFSVKKLNKEIFVQKTSSPLSNFFLFQKFFRFVSTRFTEYKLDLRVFFSVANFDGLRAIVKKFFEKNDSKK